MRAFRTTRRVEFRDTDAAGIAHFSVFFAYMEEAEHAFWRHLGTSVKQTDGEGVVSWPRVAASCDYLSSVRFEDVLDLEVTVERIGNKSVTFTFDISHEGRAIAQGRVTAACCRLTASGLQAIPLAEDIRQKLEPFATGASKGTQ